MPVDGLPTAAAAADDGALPVGAARCASCGAGRSGPYCAACGQEAVARPIRLRDLVRRLANDLLDAERGLPHTFLRLCRNPARVVRDYLRGSTVRYTGPGKYFLLSMAAVQVVAIWAGMVGEFAEGFTESLAGGEAARIGAILDRYFVFFTAPSVLVLAAVQRWLLPGTLRFAEHLVFALYISAQQSLIWIPLIPLGAVRNDAISSSAFLIGMSAGALYYFLTIRRFFALPWPATLVRGTGVLALATVLSSLLLAAALGILTLAG